MKPPVSLLTIKNKLEELNHYKFEDDEWKNFFIKEIANQNNGIKEKSFIITAATTSILFMTGFLLLQISNATLQQK